MPNIQYVFDFTEGDRDQKDLLGGKVGATTVSIVSLLVANGRVGDISAHFNSKQQAFLDFVLSHYVRVGVEELDQDKLTPLLRLRYQNSIADALADLGRAEDIGQAFAGFQQYLYRPVGSEGQARP